MSKDNATENLRAELKSLADTLEEVLSSSGDKSKEEMSKIRSKAEHALRESRHRLSEHLAGRHGAIAGADHCWFGHTPLRARYDYDNQHYIDTGAVFGGTLTLVALQSAD